MIDDSLMIRLRQFGHFRAAVSALFRRAGASMPLAPMTRIIASSFGANRVVLFIKQDPHAEDFYGAGCSLRRPGEKRAREARDEEKQGIVTCLSFAQLQAAFASVGGRGTILRPTMEIPIAVWDELVGTSQTFVDQIASSYALYIPLIDRKSELLGFFLVLRDDHFDELDLLVAEMLTHVVVIATKSIDFLKTLQKQPLSDPLVAPYSEWCDYIRDMLRSGSTVVKFKPIGGTTEERLACSPEENPDPLVLSHAAELLLNPSAPERRGDCLGERLMDGGECRGAIATRIPPRRLSITSAAPQFDEFDGLLLKAMGEQLVERAVRYERQCLLEKVFRPLVLDPDEEALRSLLVKVRQVYFRPESGCLLYWADEESRSLIAKAFVPRDESVESVEWQFAMDDPSFATHVFSAKDDDSGVIYVPVAADFPKISTAGLDRFQIQPKAPIVGVRLNLADRPVGVLIAWGQTLSNGDIERLQGLRQFLAASIQLHASDSSRAAVLDGCLNLLKATAEPISIGIIGTKCIELVRQAGFSRARLFTTTQSRDGFELRYAEPAENIKQPLIVRFAENKYARYTYENAVDHPSPFVFPDDKPLGPDPHGPDFGKGISSSWVVAPLVAAGRVFGQLVADNCPEEKRISVSMLRSLGIVASVVALVLQKHETQLQLGEYDHEWDQTAAWLVQSLWISGLRPTCALVYRADGSETLPTASIVIDDEIEAHNIAEKLKLAVENVDAAPQLQMASDQTLREALKKHSLSDFGKVKKLSPASSSERDTCDIPLVPPSGFDFLNGHLGEPVPIHAQSLQPLGALARFLQIDDLLAVRLPTWNYKPGAVLVIGRKPASSSSVKGDNTATAPTLEIGNSKLWEFSPTERGKFAALASQASAFVSEAETRQARFAERRVRFTQSMHLTSFQFLRQHIGQRAFLAVCNQNSKLRPKFEEALKERTETAAFVLAVDIRRSTDLMLQSLSASGIAHFVTNLVDEMKEVIVGHYGVFEKFTGDGALAFFPPFLSGKDAGLRALSVAEECHAIFHRRFSDGCDLFHNTLWEPGLGIGISYGNVELIQAWDRLTIVGRPVVYACRYSSCRAGKTYLTQQAYSEVNRDYGGHLDVVQVPIEIKHETTYRAYQVELRSVQRPPILEPGWVLDLEAERQGML